MSIKSFFNELSEKRDAKRKYKALAAAIKANDRALVCRALIDGADAGYFPGDTKKLPLALAIKNGNADIVETILNTNGGMSTVMLWHYDFRNLNKTNDINKQVYFLPSFLYAAIEMKKEDAAIALVKYKLVDVEDSGELMTTGAKTLARTDPRYEQLKKPLDFARAQGMQRLVWEIEDRLKPILAERAEQEAQSLSKQADEKRALAEQLLKEAEALKPKPETPPQQPRGGFKL